MDQQLGPKVTQLEARVATLEDENKILKGEVKQILTEIRTAILARDNPFDGDGTPTRPPVVNIVSTPPEPVAKVELVMPKHDEAQREEPHATRPEPAHHAPASVALDPKEPIMLRPNQQPIAPAAQPALPAPLAPQAGSPQWTLLTVAGLSAWAEDAMSRLGPLRLEILLDLCEASGHLPPDARTALSRIIELEVDEPQRAPSSNETVVILRQLEALLHDDRAPERIQRAV